MLTWLKDNAPVIGALAAALVAFVAVLQFVVVGPINARFDAVDERFDLQNKYMNARFDAVDERFDLQNKYMNARFDTMDQRFDAQDKRLDLLTNEVSELRRLTVSIIERVSRNEGQIDLLREQFQTVDAPGP